jgi:ferredoxin
MIRFLVIGSGAAAVGAIYGLIDKYGHDITIDLLTSESFSEKISGTAPSSSILMPQKTKHGKQPATWDCKDSSLKIYDSRYHSMTQFWGAGMMPAKLDEEPNLAPEYSLASERLLQRIPMLGEDDYLTQYLGRKSHNLAWPNQSNFPKLNITYDNMKFCSGRARISLVSSPSKGCIVCGKCMSGCPEDVIWHSRIEIEKISKLVNLNTLHGEVKRITAENLVISTEDGLSNVDLKGYKSTILCTGVVSTIKIVLDSLDYVESIGFYDTPVYTLPVFIFGNSYKQRISLANDMILIGGPDGTQLASVYPFFDEIWETTVFKFFRPIKFFRRVVENHIGFVRLYSNKQNPLKITAKLNEDNSLNLSRSKWWICSKDQKLQSNLKKVLRKNGVYSFPFKLTSLNSAHYYGGSLTRVASKPIIEILKEKFPRVKFADAFIITDMPSISPTFSIMVNAYCKAQEINDFD